LNIIRYITICLLLFLTVPYTWAQSSFEFPKKRTQDRIDFKLINNLILIPVLVNDTPLNFLLDTGASSTVIFSFEETEEIELYNYTIIKLRGLGKGEPVDALKSVGNNIQIGRAKSTNQTIYVVFDGALNFSARLGYPVHGIIGNDFLKDFVVEVNNVREQIRFYFPEHHKMRNCRRCVKKELVFQADKPYVIASFKEGEVEMEVNLLIDSGSGDGLWLFENSHEDIILPEDSFEDYLGLGINGNIYGKRSKVESLMLADFELKNVNTSYPDIDFLDVLKDMGNRNGSLGGEILKRFNWTIDYTNKQIQFRRNRYFRDPFHYNMSGLTLQQGGFTLVRERSGVRPDPYGLNQSKTLPVFNVNLSTNVQLSLKQLFEVVELRENSPAYLAGVQVGDEILEVNNKPAYQYTLNEINELFYSKEGRTIRMKISRNGVQKQVRFDLIDM
jgi:hypothetical protein